MFCFLRRDERNMLCLLIEFKQFPGSGGISFGKIHKHIRIRGIRKKGAYQDRAELLPPLFSGKLRWLKLAWQEKIKEFPDFIARFPASA